MCFLAGALVAGLALPMIGGGAVAAKMAAQDFAALPSDIQSQPPAEASVVLAADGRRIATFYDENRSAVPLSKVSAIMKKAILAIEDVRFYDHGGIDLKGTLRALVSNSGGEGGRQGGSTLTQQYVKNLLIQLSDGDPDKIAAARAPTIKRKLQELKYALEIEKRMNKDEILENYLNISYFGSGAYGVEAAARRYFSKSSNNLTLTEAATLAGIVRSPTKNDPTLNPDIAKERRDVVLTRMRDVGYISNDQLEKAKAEDLGLRTSPTFNGCTRSPVPFFCDYITRVIMNDPIFGETERDRSDLLSRGGLTIRTTLDLKAQEAADEAIQKKTNPTDKVASALASVEPGTGKIRAMATEPGVRHGTRARPSSTTRSTTSTAAAAASRTARRTRPSPRPRPSSRATAPSTRSTPRCASAASPRSATARASASRRTAGVRRTTRTSRRSTAPSSRCARGCASRSTPTSRSWRRWSASATPSRWRPPPASTARTACPSASSCPYTLGINEVSPLTVANSYATFAARGLRCNPIAIESITGRDGKEVPVPKADCKQTIKAEVADVVTDMMVSVMQPSGFGNKMRLDSGQVAGGKTGTTNGAVAVWFTGYTPQLSTSVWVGNPDDYSFKMGDMTIGGEYYEEVCGSCVPGPIWKLMMDKALDGVAKKEFHKPEAKWLRGTQGQGDPRKAHVTYKVAKEKKEDKKDEDKKND